MVNIPSEGFQWYSAKVTIWQLGVLLELLMKAAIDSVQQFE